MVVLGFTQCTENATTHMSHITPPQAAEKPQELVHLGDTRIDPFYWLRERENQEVIDYLNAENDYTASVMKPYDELKEKLFQEIKGRIKEDDSSTPYFQNGYWYYSRYETGKEYPIYCRKKDSLESTEEILIDCNEKAKEHSFYQVGNYAVSPNNKLLAYCEDTQGRRIYTVRVLNLETGELHQESLENSSTNLAWANDNKTFFYTQKDETLREFQIYSHVLGTQQTADKLEYEEKDDTFYCYVGRSKSGKYISIGSYSTLSAEVQVAPTDDPSGNFRSILPREEKHEYSVAHIDNTFYILTNYKAKNFRLMKCEETNTAKENWQEVIPHRDDVLLEDIDLFEDFYILSERKNGLVQLRVKSWDGNRDEYIPFNDPAYVVYMGNNPEMKTEEVQFVYTSLTTPTSTFSYNIESKKQELLKQQAVLGDFNADNYTSERIWVEARDKTKVPVSIVYRKDTKVDGTAPLLLYAYGSYGYSMDPYFSSARLSLLDRGFVFAIAHIRGGSELGRAWYENGKMLNKKNTFTDFIDCAESLKSQGYSAPNKLYAMGGSAGGLLMGAIANMSPQTFDGIVAQVPFVDVVTTMLDESIPLTTGEYDEWGNPNQKEYYEYMLSYSPYDNVEKKAYPAMLITTGLHDSQVQYWEPAKWIAKLRQNNTGTEDLVLHTNMDAGHGGASGRFEAFKEVALDYAFLLKQAGIKE